MTKLVFSLALIFFSLSCVTSVDLELETSSAKVVIEGLLTDEIYDHDFQEKYFREKDGNYVRLTYSDPINDFSTDALSEDPNFYAQDRTRAIRNATVWITDDLGLIDTLLADSAQNEPFIGYYKPQKLVCKAGRTYNLHVNIGDKAFSASAYMPAVSNLDSVTTVFVKDPVNELSGYRPQYYFKNNPATREYFLTKISRVPQYSDAVVPPFFHFNSVLEPVWNYQVVSDELLPDYVNGLAIKLGATSSTYLSGKLETGAEYDACLYSLTHEAYNYYSALIKAFRNDGGAYSPSPASPPSNIQGGALGFFNASSASIKRFKAQ